MGQKVLLDDPARGKLDPKWTEPWEVNSVKEPLTLALQMGSAKSVVHFNRVRPLLIGDVDSFSSSGRWSPPLFNHYESSVQAQDLQDGGNSTGCHHTVVRSGWVVRRPDYYGMSGDT